MYYQQKYIKYKHKYQILGGSWKKKAEERKCREEEEKNKAEEIKKVLKAWEKITNTELFRAEVEMIITSHENISVEEAIEIVKTEIKENEQIRQRYYAIQSIQEALDYLELKPSTEIYMSTSNLDEDDFM